MLDIGRGALVVIGGYALMAVLVILSTILLAAYFPGADPAQPSQTYVTGSLVCGFIAALIGGYVTARMAAQRPLLHVCVLVAVLVGVGLFSLTSEPQPGQPAWYPAAIVALGAIGAFIGGFIRAARVEKIS